MSNQQQQFERQQREEDLEEVKETEVSRKLSAAMYRSARGSYDETLMKAVDVLQNQNGNFFFQK